MRNSILIAICVFIFSGCAEMSKMKWAARADGSRCCTMGERDKDDDDNEDEAHEQFLRSAARDYIMQWDADDNGQLPRSSQIVGADVARKALLNGEASVASSGPGEKTRTLAAGISATQWTPLGPGNVGGRIRSVIIDPRNPTRIFVGSVTGGIWLSQDGGASFNPVQDFLSNIAIGAMAMDPSNPNVMYAGTGESYSGFSGAGMFKSVDGGLTWSFLNATTTDASNPNGADWVFVNRIVVNPANPNIILSANTNGSNLTTGAIYRSVDGGISWGKVLAVEAIDIKIDPNNPNNLVMGGDTGYVYYSRDAGASWARGAPLVTTLTGRGTTARVELAYAASLANVVYASLDNNSGDIWKSVDGGVSWAFLSNPQHLSDQGDYANTIWVDPTNPQQLVVGGLDLYLSTNGGISFNKISNWQSAGTGQPQPHADHHVIVSPANFSASNPVVYIGNDGGLFRATNIFTASANGTSTWQNLNNQLAITQFYGGAGKSSAGGHLIGGTQDNGTLGYSSGTNWLRYAGGDGGFVAVDPVSDATAYGEYIYASIHRSINFNSRTYICSGITEALPNASGSVYCGANATQQANFIAPFVLDPNNGDRMLVGANSLWLSANVRAATPSWVAIKPPAITAGNPKHYINAIDVAARDSNVIWVGHNGATVTGGDAGFVYKTVNGLSAAPTWQRVGAGVLPASTVNRITIDPDNVNRVWVAYSGFATNRLWETLDGGASWHSITANLPAVTLHDIKRHPTQSQWLYAAAANGVYTSINGGQSWSTVNDGPASVRVRELFWYSQSSLIAATFGRGMFAANVAGATAGNYQDLWYNSAEDGWGMTVTQHGNTQVNILFIYDATGKPQWVIMQGGTWNANFTTYTGDVYIPTGPPFSAYNSALHSVGPKVGTLTVNYTSNTTAQIQYTINGVSGAKTLQRFDFNAIDNTPVLSVGDLWWTPGEIGWGLNITQQYRTLFAVWYTYDQNGKEAWYSMSGGSWTGNTYVTDILYTTGSPWIGTAYNPKLLSYTKVGTMRIAFSDANNAVMTYTVNGITQTKPIIRLAF